MEGYSWGGGGIMERATILFVWSTLCSRQETFLFSFAPKIAQK